MAARVKVAREVEVVGVHQQEWYRVVVGSLVEGKVTLKTLDYGHHLFAGGVN